jgi:hypothetical protein
MACGLSLHAQAGKPLLSRAAGLEIRPSVMDHGDKWVGQELTSEFAIRNTSSKRQRLYEFVSSCACKRVTIEIGTRQLSLKQIRNQGAHLEPGARCRIRLVMKVARSGIQAQAIRFRATSKPAAFIPLVSRVNGIPTFRVTRKGRRVTEIRFAEIIQGQSPSVEIAVIPQRWPKTKLSLDSAHKEAAKLQLSKVKAGWSLFVQLRSQKTLGALDETITIRSSQGDNLVLPLTGFVVPRFSIRPALLVFRWNPEAKVYIALAELQDRQSGNSISPSEVAIETGDSKRKVGHRAVPMREGEKWRSIADKHSVELILPTLPNSEHNRQRGRIFMTAPSSGAVSAPYITLNYAREANAK